MKAPRAFTLLELLLVIAMVALLAGLIVSGLSGAKARVRAAACLNHLRQWGAAVHLYAADHEDYLPPEGVAAPGLTSRSKGWYTALPAVMGLPSYYEMPWRTNSALVIGANLFICPANRRRATNDNLFHYCLNEHIDGTGLSDRPVRLASIPHPTRTVYLFDNGKLAAVAQQNNVHTNLHQNGAQFVFLDARAARFRNREYWDFISNRGRTNNPDLIWAP